MRRILFSAMLLASTLPAMADGVGVSITVDQPGLYGRVDIGNVPPPQVIYAQPVIVASAPAAVVLAPIYLHVPPNHARHWRRHCHQYGACGQPVYFVQEHWYNEVYVPARRQHRDDDEHHGDHEQNHDPRQEHGGRDSGDPGGHRGEGHDNEHDRGGKKD